MDGYLQLLVIRRDGKMTVAGFDCWSVVSPRPPGAVLFEARSNVRREMRLAKAHADSSERNIDLSHQLSRLGDSVPRFRSDFHQLAPRPHARLLSLGSHPGSVS